MAEKNTMTTLAQLEMLALRVKEDSTARIAELAALVAAGYGHLITIALPTASWSGQVQTIKNETLLADSGYCYFIFGDGVKADDITVDGQVTFRCETVPDTDLTVYILRLEVAI